MQKPIVEDISFEIPRSTIGGPKPADCTKFFFIARNFGFFKENTGPGAGVTFAAPVAAKKKKKQKKATLRSRDSSLPGLAALEVTAKRWLAGARVRPETAVHGKLKTKQAARAFSAEGTLAYVKRRLPRILIRANKGGRQFPRFRWGMGTKKMAAFFIRCSAGSPPRRVRHAQAFGLTDLEPLRKAWKKGPGRGKVGEFDSPARPPKNAARAVPGTNDFLAGDTKRRFSGRGKKKGRRILRHADPAKTHHRRDGQKGR